MMNFKVPEAEVLVLVIVVTAVVAAWRLEQIPLINTNPIITEIEGRPHLKQP